MKRLVAEVTKLPSGSLRPQFYFVDESGINRSVTETLLDLVSESSAKALAELEVLIESSERGGYKPENPDLPDWSVNEKYVWLRPPMAGPGFICISNEYSGEYSHSEGRPQLFTYRQFHDAVRHWRGFLEAFRERGGENLVGQPIEMNVE
ncbi:hypothetical protein [Dyella subtropica]|uniref:hypothetical protein n=1 Tax=Dyella subtropica TaxID=2992127 RepID=UPI002251ED64|nr:hypothetical protein [Dyella subtropica]